MTLSIQAYTSKQIAIAKLTIDEWSKIEINGKKYPFTGFIMSYLESSFGMNVLGDMDSKVTNASLGITQMQLNTAKFIASIYKQFSFILEMSDIQLVNYLLTNHRMNIRLAGYYFKYNMKRFNDHSKAVSAHNGGTRNLPYLKRYRKAREELYPLYQQLKR